MKKIVLSIVVAASVLTACKGKKEKVEVKEAVKVEVNAADLNNVNTQASVISWKGTKPTGSHNGTVALKSGGLVIEDGKPTKGVFVIDMTSIKVLDIPESEEGNGKLTGHLSSPDFFDVAKYPTSKFVITSVEEKEGKLAVTGNLTLRDITKSITIPATISTEGDVTTFTSETFNVDRTDFGVTYKSKKLDAALKDKFIDDIMELQFTVVTK
ncbi:YceI family protein [Polaribacter cellanae]|uniref:YceI family protein n=1 Tax=Polaribacter cellanae TaxID=2818493 RepID=A0A975CNF5_9FLAO|nr:YceI family protein [Polaribacter cellanae]QTE21879.1 YceI family protein [Polaribacter cellanae]